MDRIRSLTLPRHEAQIAKRYGQLLGEGGVAERLHPRATRWVRLFLPAASTGTYWALGLTGGRLPLGLAILLGMAPFALFASLLRAFPHWRVRRALAPARTEEPLAELPSGAPVWLRGVITAQPTVSTPSLETEAVLFRHWTDDADETRGIDFHIALESGFARVCVQGAVLLDPPHRARQPAFVDEWWRCFEAAVGPGDEIEVSGVLHHEEAPDAATPFDRHVAIEAVIRSAPGRPLLVRRARP
jgi:hypothetical protein